MGSILAYRFSTARILFKTFFLSLYYRMPFKHDVHLIKGGDPQQPVVTQETHKPLPVYHRWAN
jgi:hypothetical protein